MEQSNFRQTREIKGGVGQVTPEKVDGKRKNMQELLKFTRLRDQKISQINALGVENASNTEARSILRKELGIIEQRIEELNKGTNLLGMAQAKTGPILNQ